MSEAQDHILKMLEQGTITAEEADRLLAALGPDQGVSTVDGGLAVTEPIVSGPLPSDLPASLPGEIGPQPPDSSRFRRFLQLPFAIACGSLLLSGLGLAFMYQADEQVATLGFLCVWSIFILAFLTMIIILLARRAPWLHVRVQEKEGRRLAISLPLPLGLARWVLGIARYYVPKEQALHLDTAATFIESMRDNPDQEPIFIDVDDDDGDKVQVYIG